VKVKLEIQVLIHLVKVLGIGVFVLLALGSATSQEQKQQYMSNLQNRCAGYGFRQGTPEYSNCLMQLDTQNNAAAARQSRCYGAMSQAYADPGRTGNFGEAQVRANAAYNRCMNGS
jgi:hypothetical protein